MTTLARILEKQWLHAALLIVLLLGATWLGRLESAQAGALWGVGAATWYWLAIGIAVIHQVYVWLCWRIELHGRGLSRLLGRFAFDTFVLGFAVLGLLRVTLVFVLAIANRHSLPGSHAIYRLLAVVVAALAAYLLYSVARYFGFVVPWARITSPQRTGRCLSSARESFDGRPMQCMSSAS